MRSGQDGRMNAGRPPSQSREGGDERLAGQYEKDPWPAQGRPESSRRWPESRAREGRPDPESSSTEPSRYPPGPKGPGPKGYQRSDERLREDISERLMEARDIDSSGVTVEVIGAKVVLEGTVPERPMKHAIEDLVDACPGVQDIENRVQVRR